MKRTVAIEASSVDAAIGLVRGGLGLGFLPDHVPATHADLRAVALKEEVPAIPVAVVTAADRTPSAATRALVEELLRASRD